MSMSTLVPTLPPVVPPVPVRRFTVAEYHQMIQAGILGEDDNVELLEGASRVCLLINPQQRTPHSVRGENLRFLVPAKSS